MARLWVRNPTTVRRSPPFDVGSLPVLFWLGVWGSMFDGCVSPCRGEIGKSGRDSFFVVPRLQTSSTCVPENRWGYLVIYKFFSSTAVFIQGAVSDGAHAPLTSLVALITAMTAAGVAVWTNYSTSKRFKKQLDHETLRLSRQLDAESERQAQRLAHEAQQKDADRLLTLRREIYLQFPIILGEALDNLRNLPLCDSDEGLGVGVSGFTQLAKQVALLSQRDTSDAILALDEEIQKSWLFYLDVVRPTQTIRRRLKLALAAAQDANESLDRMKPLLEKAIVGGDANLRTKLVAQIGMLNQSNDDEAAKASKLKVELHQSIMSASNMYGAIGLNLNPFIAKAMRMIRRDVGFVAGLDDFEKDLHARELRIADEIASFAARIRELTQ
jgi:hypothetical protein